MKPCTHCGKEFAPQRIGQACCGPICAIRMAKAARQAKKAAERALTHKRREALKTISDRIKEAQIEFNKFCRLRDRLAGHPCISSGRQLDWSGNGVDAGHYRSTGAAPQLRFDERNCHSQSKQENRYLAGNAADYRIGLVARIGIEAVEALESDNRVHKWTHAELIAIKALYLAKCRAMRDLEAA